VSKRSGLRVGGNATLPDCDCEMHPSYLGKRRLRNRCPADTRPKTTCMDVKVAYTLMRIALPSAPFDLLRRKVEMGRITVCSGRSVTGQGRSR
jgi:hypothetical protein